MLTLRTCETRGFPTSVASTVVTVMSKLEKASRSEPSEVDRTSGQLVLGTVRPAVSVGDNKIVYVYPISTVTSLFGGVQVRKSQ